jgi:hypothetical protein
MPFVPSEQISRNDSGVISQETIKLASRIAAFSKESYSDRYLMKKRIKSPMLNEPDLELSRSENSSRI